MFQSFTSTSNPEMGPERLAELRKVMDKAGVTAFLVPHADEHQNEYLPERAERLAWLTGFSGSAGFAIATLSDCYVFVDGRYTLQVREQTDPDAFTPESLIDNPPSAWLAKNTSTEDVIAYDPWLITAKQLETFEKSAAKSGAKLKPVANLIDQIWLDQPDAPLGSLKLHPENYAGKSAQAKIQNIQSKITEQSCELCLLTDPASLAWLFNIRGSDVVHNPLALGFAIVPTSAKPILFMDNRKVSAEIRDTLSKIIEFHEPDQLEDEIKKRVREKAVLCDENLLPAYLADVIKQAGGKIEHGRDPVVLPRAIKNPTEIEGTKKSQIRDGVAVCKFLCWLDHQKPSAITEISAAQKLEALRASNAIEMGSELEEISFDAISAFGPHAAIPHYRVSNKTSLQFESDTLYLIDSGGQYLDGTTDITRTVAVGNPPKSAVVDFTLVLKGHIAIATTRFPKGTRGVDLDPFARHALWQEGKDFNHGTGHGVGAYLNVHEGPQSISKRGMEVLKPGMIISNEPGYYVEGAYGIRIENLVLVTEQEKLENGNVETHSFETLTLAPIDTRLVAASMLTDAEREWLNDYHVWVRETLLPHLSDDHERDWLVATTKAI